MKELAERQAAKATFEEWKARAVAQGMDRAKVERFFQEGMRAAALLPHAPERVSLRATHYPCR
jgi:hypothetical protein